MLETASKYICKLMSALIAYYVRSLMGLLWPREVKATRALRVECKGDFPDLPSGPEDGHSLERRDNLSARHCADDLIRRPRRIRFRMAGLDCSQGRFDLSRRLGDHRERRACIPPASRPAGRLPDGTAQHARRGGRRHGGTTPAGLLGRTDSRVNS